MMPKIEITKIGSLSPRPYVAPPRRATSIADLPTDIMQNDIMRYAGVYSSQNQFALGLVSRQWQKMYTHALIYPAQQILSDYFRERPIDDNRDLICGLRRQNIGDALRAANNLHTVFSKALPLQKKMAVPGYIIDSVQESLLLMQSAKRELLDAKKSSKKFNTNLIEKAVVAAQFLRRKLKAPLDAMINHCQNEYKRHLHLSQLNELQESRFAQLKNIILSSILANSSMLDLSTGDFIKLNDDVAEMEDVDVLNILNYFDNTLAAYLPDLESLAIDMSWIPDEPNWVAKFKNLKVLDIKYFTLLASHPIFEEMSHLEQLKITYVDDDDYLPPKILNLQALKSLDISGSHFNCMKPMSPLWRLLSLVRLSIQQNHIDDGRPIPPFYFSQGLENLKNLKILNASDLQNWPVGVEKLTSLEELRLSFNCKSNCSEPLPSLPDVKVLSIHNWQDFKIDDRQLPALETLHVCPKSLVQFAGRFDLLTGLKKFAFSGKLDDALIRAIAQLPNLEVLEAVGYDSLPIEFVQASSLKVFRSEQGHQNYSQLIGKLMPSLMLETSPMTTRFDF